MEVNWCLASVLIVLWGFGNETSGLECDSSAYVACRDELDDLKEYKQKHQYATDNNALNEMCSKQLLALSCVRTIAEKCLQEEEQEVYKMLIKGSNKFFENFCFEDSQLRKRYLNHSRCISDIAVNLDTCSKEYENSQKKLDEHEGNANTLKQRTCCLYFENIHCSANVTLENCGKDAADLVKELWSLLGGTYLNEMCEPFSKYDFQSCSPVSVGFRNNANLLTVLFPVLYTAISYYLR